VILVDQAGVPADLGAMQALCQPHGITVIEDAACAVGSFYDGRPVGARAQLAAFSFHPRKLLTTGEGGMLVTPSGEVAARLRRLREHGMDLSAAVRHATRQPMIEHYVEVGFNFRMTDIQAAIGLVQLRKLEELVARRRTLARRYQDMLVDIPGVRTVIDPPCGTTNYQSFWLVLADDFPITRDELLQQLADAGVSARRGIMAAHLEPAYEGSAQRPLPVSERLTARTLILPLFHDLTEAEQDRIVAVIAAAARPAARAGTRG
jgi:perosamine synthetase